MNTLNKCRMASMIGVIVALLGPAAWAFGPGQAAITSKAGPATPTINLGGIMVHGQRPILQVLQAIKVGLKQPVSSDPKLANVVVCRISNDIGTHANQLLMCATNATLMKREYRSQLAWSLGLTAAAVAGGGERAMINTLNEYLPHMPQHILHMRVNGSGLRALLQKIPNPAPMVPSSHAPAAGTHPHNGL